MFHVSVGVVLTPVDPDEGDASTAVSGGAGEKGTNADVSFHIAVTRFLIAL